ncbi:MAG: hypothetical protein AOA66_1704 [Candidatus Bathyarchaeota archaeon BA2]|nr:MAG: hypothetical protein AOA66_1704 [Candidatus Bathyarchaeota archaeon BA2]
MKKFVRAHLLFLLLVVALAMPVHASVMTQAIINENIQVLFDFRNIRSDIYGNITITESTIPEIIKNNLMQRGLTNVDYRSGPLDYPTENSVRVSFILFGSDVLNFTLKGETMTKTYYVRTDWIKFQVNLASDFSIDFTEYFGKPVAEWEKIDYPLNGEMHLAYMYNYTGPSSFDPVCYFILPTEAKNVNAVGDTIIFELPPSFEDSLLNSPFLILGALMVLNIAFFLYRKVRR